MFGIGFFELLIICVISLLVLGPSRLPQFITSLEELFVKSRNSINRFKQEFYSEGFEKKEKEKDE
jgi:sec-independent protein translocase protein TatB